MEPYRVAWGLCQEYQVSPQRWVWALFESYTIIRSREEFGRDGPPAHYLANAAHYTRVKQAIQESEAPEAHARHADVIAQAENELYRDESLLGLYRDKNAGFYWFGLVESGTVSPWHVVVPPHRLDLEEWLPKLDDHTQTTILEAVEKFESFNDAQRACLERVKATGRRYRS